MKKTLLLFFLLVLAQPVFAQEPGKIFNAESFRLDNGMQIVVIPNHRAPVVAHMVWYKTGGADEEPGKSGVAHFLEHLMFKGSSVIGGNPLAPGEFSETIRALGGNDNAFTSEDYTAFHQSIALKHLETLMRMEAGRMRGLNPPLPEVESERKVVIEERRQRTDNDPRGAFRERMASTLFPDHPYGIPTLGWPEEMEKLNWPDEKAFYDRWYAPNNAILVVSGDVTGQQVLELAKATYGTIPAAPVPKRARMAKPPPMPPGPSGRVEMHHPAVRQPVFQIGIRVPGYPRNHQNSLALEVLEEIAGGGPTSRLYKSLVVERKIATDAGMSYDGNVVDDAVFWIYASPAPGVAPKEIEDAINDELRKLAAQPVTPEELHDAISRLQDQSVYARDSLEGPAMIFGGALAVGMKVDDIEYWPRNIGAMSAAQIQEAVKKYLDPDLKERKSVTGILLPGEEEPAVLPVPEEKKK